jgi:hypothetical protein
MNSSTENYCCCACVGDEFLSARVKAEGEIAECAQCGQEREAVTEFDLGQWIETVLEDHFEPGEGDSIATIIEEIAGLNETLSEEIAESLASIAGYQASGGETFYDSDDGYVVARRYPDMSDRRWESFRDSVRAEARFFNRTAEKWLDHVFGSLSEDRTWHGKEVFKTIEAGVGFFRARHVADVAKAYEILGRPAALLGPLPNGKGSAGRMNAAGVSVFYGALDIDTCIAEIRPPVGSIALSARFDLVRPVRLLDFDLLETVEAKCSHFDPEYDEKQERAMFLRAFGRRIAQPVMPDDEAFGYLPTQIVADYLAQRPTPAIDGILFRSTQTGGRGRNVVLFNRASRVEPKPVQPREFELSVLDDIFGDAPAPIEPDPFPINVDDGRLATLRIDPDSIQISDVRAVSYIEKRQSVEFWQLDLEERERECD